MTYLLFLLLLVVAVVVTYFVTKKKSFNSGYIHGELTERAKHKIAEDATIKWDYNRMVLKGLNPLNGINIYEDKKLSDKNEIPQFGINLKYKPNDEESSTRHFDVNIYCDYTNKVNENISIFHDGNVSDGYHTFEELYYYRLCYNAALINTLTSLKDVLPNSFKSIKVCKSKKHFGGEPCYGGGWFIVMINTPWGQISNHYRLEHWDKFNCPITRESWKWDGHGMKEAMERLNKLSKYVVKITH